MHITVNLGNAKLNISERGYDTLKALLRKLTDSVPDTMRQMVQDDAESRLAEYFTTKVATDNVITEADVEAAFANLGFGSSSSRQQDAEASDADFESSENQGTDKADTNSGPTQAEGDQTANTAQPNGTAEPLRRDLTDVFISGVCSGIARKMDCDVVWIRLAFVFGTIFLAQIWVPVAYLVLWLVLPPSGTAESEGPDIRFDSDGGAQKNGCLRGCLIVAICIVALIAVGLLFMLPFGLIGLVL